jgi:hypothetical protein
LKASNAISNRKAPPGSRPGNEDSFSRAAERFRLTGPSIVLDPRIHAYRSDIADIALAGQLFAPHYARAMMRRTLRPSSVRAAPSPTADTITDLGAAEEFAVLDISGGWAWGYRRANHHVGYVPAADLEEMS